MPARRLERTFGEWCRDVLFSGRSGLHTPRKMLQILRALANRPGRLILGTGLVLAIAYSIATLALPRRGGRLVVGDAVHYYVYVRSAVFDRDLQFRDDYAGVYGIKPGEPLPEWLRVPTATGHVQNMMSVGPPILWTPLFVLVTFGVAIARLFGSTYPLDGFGWLFQVSAGYSGIAAGVAGVWLAYRLAARYFDRQTAAWSTLAVWLGSSALYYTGMSPTYSHSASMLAVSALLLVWAGSIERQTLARYALVGLLAGFVALVRWQDAVFLIVPLVDVVWHAVRPTGEAARSTLAGRASRGAVQLAACGVGALIAFLPQTAVWMVLYGQPFTMPQTGEWMRWSAPFWPHVLFSDWHGLLTWTPIVGLALMGLVPLFRRDALLATALVAAFLASLWANGSVVEWWGGEAYGARRFVSCFPIFVVGLCGLIAAIPRHRGALFTAVWALVVLNGLLLLQYELMMHGLARIAPYPRGFYALVVARFVVPFKLLGWLAG